MYLVINSLHNIQNGIQHIYIYFQCIHNIQRYIFWYMNVSKISTYIQTYPNYIYMYLKYVFFDSNFAHQFLVKPAHHIALSTSPFWIMYSLCQWWYFFFLVIVLLLPTIIAQCWDFTFSIYTESRKKRT